MKHLNGLTAYLAGPIDNYDGENWRARYLKSFKKLGLKIYDPLVKPNWLSEISGCKQLPSYVIDDMHNGKYNKYKNDSAECRNTCLSMLSHSDLMIVYLPKIFTIGTIDEIIECDKQVKPIVFIFDKEFISSLYMADLFNRHLCFNSFESAILELESINEYGILHDDMNMNLRWLPITHKSV